MPDHVPPEVLEQRFTQQSFEVLYHARRELSRQPMKTLEPEHVILGILRAEPATIASLLAAGWTIERLEESLALGPTVAGSLPEDAEVPVSPAVVMLIKRALFEADQLRSVYVEPRHLILAILADETHRVSDLLRQAGLSREAVLRMPR